MAQVCIDDAPAFVSFFAKTMDADGRLHPLPLVLSPRIIADHALARLRRVTLALVAGAGSQGLPVAFLRAAYEAFDVKPALADNIERILTTQGLIKATGDRLTFVGTRATIQRLSEAKA